MQPTFPASKPLSRVFMQAIDAPLPGGAHEAAADAAVPVADPPAPAVQPTGQKDCKHIVAPKALLANVLYGSLYCIMCSTAVSLLCHHSIVTA